MESQALDTRTPGNRLVFRYEQVQGPDLLVFVEPTTGLETTIRLTADGPQTEITIHQRRLPPELRTGQAREGLVGLLNALAEHVKHHIEGHR